MSMRFKAEEPKTRDNVFYEREQTKPPESIDEAYHDMLNMLREQENGIGKSDGERDKLQATLMQEKMRADKASAELQLLQANFNGKTKVLTKEAEELLGRAKAAEDKVRGMQKALDTRAAVISTLKTNLGARENSLSTANYVLSQVKDELQATEELLKTKSRELSDANGLIAARDAALAISEAEATQAKGDAVHAKADAAFANERLMKLWEEMDKGRNPLSKKRKECSEAPAPEAPKKQIKRGRKPRVDPDESGA